MIQEDELIMLLLGIGVLFFLVTNYQAIKRYPGANFLIAAFGALFLGWCFTIIEGFLLEWLFNLAEHVCYLASACCLAAWVRVLKINNKEISG